VKIALTNSASKSSGQRLASGVQSTDFSRVLLIEEKPN